MSRERFDYSTAVLLVHVHCDGSYNVLAYFCISTATFYMRNTAARWTLCRFCDVSTCASKQHLDHCPVVKGFIHQANGHLVGQPYYQSSCSFNRQETVLLISKQNTWAPNCFMLQPTLALWTPCYYGHPANTHICKLTETNSRYYGLSLLWTYGHFAQSRWHNFIVLTLIIMDGERNVLTLAKQS